MADKLDKEKYN